MATINECALPDSLLYHVGHNEWLRDNGDGTYTLGMTDIAQSMAGTVIHCRMKKPGKSVKEGKSLATVESGKWVGPVKAPFECEVVEKNDAVEADAALVNRSPYKEGWIVKIKPADAPAARALLVDAEAAGKAFETYMAERGVERCSHCEGFDDSA